MPEYEELDLSVFGGPTDSEAWERAVREAEETKIWGAYEANDVGETKRLVNNALIDTTLPHYYRFRYEAILATLPGCDELAHAVRAWRVLTIMDKNLRKHPETKFEHFEAIHGIDAILVNLSGKSREELNELAKNLPDASMVPQLEDVFMSIED